MPHTTLITTDALAQHLADPNWAIFDCRFDLADAGWGEAQYRAAHIPGAAYVHLDRDLSGEKTGRNGRHPLPEDGQFFDRLYRWGVTPDTQVVAYDQNNGMWASRLWWMLRYFGHESVAVLDGGLAKWLSEGRPTRTGEECRTPALFGLQSGDKMLLTVDEVEQVHADPAWRLVDARTPERYRGEAEPIDPVAGHIPGAVNHPNALNVKADGTFRAPEELRARFLSLLADVPPERAVMYCGSGVAACHNALAMEHAGLPGPKVYLGSWSEWSSDPARGVARGE
jgi:thiosulfate/3-mercaptopyruvate sulfurtransferase